MGFVDAVKAFYKNYFDFSGRASRSEYWWAYLGVIILFFVLGLLGGLLGEAGMIVLGLFYLAIIIPSISIGVRRLHDLDKSGWWYLLCLVPIVSLILLVWFCMKGTTGPNRFGPDPLGSDTTVFN